MSIIRDEKHERLRFGVGEAGGERQAGVALAMFASIPVGSLVTARLDVPTELNTNVTQQGVNGATVAPSLAPQPYIFEHAAEPGPYTFGFVTQRGRNRVLAPTGLGPVNVRQEEPAWAAFAPTVVGSLKQKGKAVHLIQMPGGGGVNDNLKPEDRHLLRLRWTGTAIAGENIGTGTGAVQSILDKQLGGVAPKTRIAPGSVIVHYTLAAAPVTLRDDGKGRIVGNGADGFIDYFNGVITKLRFSPGADLASAITVDYEHSCLYQPLDAVVEYDAQMGM